ncbi:hypothetical protein TRIUR3_27718 [Triticum urartu]|uniref:Uncharacterized protein n=1 Tax=Triticum urartu TaxID=4572 RepID=M7ZFM8_TRIUA|nr:hypothetical protein TRIUR3_27718 [Triticum urartu]
MAESMSDALSSPYPASSLAGHEHREVKLRKGENMSSLPGTQAVAASHVLFFLAGVRLVDGAGHRYAGLGVMAAGCEPRSLWSISGVYLWSISCPSRAWLQDEQTYEEP